MTKRGITLLEIMVTVSIVGIAAAMSSSAFSELRRTGQIREETRALRNYLRNARTLAVTRQVPHGVYIGGQDDPVAAFRNRMVLFSKVDPETLPTQFDYNPANDRIVLDHFFPTGVQNQPMIVVNELEANTNSSIRIVFDSDGVPTLFKHFAGGPIAWPFIGGRVVVMMRHSGMGNWGLNASTRCVGIFESGDAVVLHSDPSLPLCR